MINVYCDVCKKKMDNPITDKTFFYYAETCVCETCKDNLEYQLRAQIRARDSFSMDWYRKLLSDTFTRAAQRGRS
jgi:hydrogenase maturation factor HypF (carbamoyltransferase family)